ncbi:hypothetical protein D9615_003147 [Tricholomella constricta]|uniref:lytic cellulose monooxygenase (C4-dehydrogenating) n=1 Tax=Tricholomella constricta TaxID=117010 RepID=A0A8H5HIS3_9AGAR|nr:hypothetical protein D9615_003147 [Tricholomella constricta]
MLLAAREGTLCPHEAKHSPTHQATERGRHHSGNELHLAQHPPHLDMQFLASLVLSLGTIASAHYVFPSLVVNGVVTPEWMNVRKTDNIYTREPVTNVQSPDFRCYTSQTQATASTVSVAAGSQLGIQSNSLLYHLGVVNVYMAKAPVNVSTWDGSGDVWFRVHEISAVTDGGTSITFPAFNLPGVNFTLPESLPSGEYLVRIEAIALHDAGYVGGAQFYIGCGQINVTDGGCGSPGPLVAIPGVYTGTEPGILIDIHYPIPKTYVQPGPAVWSG